MFETHKLNDQGFERVKELKQAVSDTVIEQFSKIKDCREKSIAITKLEESMFFATKALASDPENHIEVIQY